jgi:hypothetical protein
MRLLIGIVFFTFAFIAKAEILQSSVQDLTALSPDVGFLVENPTSDKMHFILNVIPKDCPSLGLDSMKLRGSMSSIDSKGEIQANDFMVAYYSLGYYNYKTPCILESYLHTTVGEEINEASLIIDTSSFNNEKTDVHINNGIEVPIQIKHSFKRMNNTHYELTLLLQNRSNSPKLVELRRLKIDCESGDVFIKQTDNFPDGIKNGRSEIKEQSWRAYKVVYESTEQPFNCSSTATFDGASPYKFNIKNYFKSKSDHDF